jgi:hypothetical protein
MRHPDTKNAGDFLIREVLRKRTQLIVAHAGATQTSPCAQQQPSSLMS